MCKQSEVGLVYLCHKTHDLIARVVLVGQLRLCALRSLHSFYEYTKANALYTYTSRIWKRQQIFVALDMVQVRVHSCYTFFYFN